MKKVFAVLIAFIFLSTSVCARAEGFALRSRVQSAVLIDGETGDMLYGLHEDMHIYPASTTKILTVFLGLLLKDTEETVTISQRAVRLPDANAVRIGLIAGEQLRFGDLLQATLTQSGNDGAQVIAEAVSGSMDAFVDVMNAYAVAIGCTDTHFSNPSGLHDEMHYTSARDAARIAFEAMQSEEFREMAAAGRYTLPETDKNAARSFSSHGRSFYENRQSQHYYSGAMGIKTGYHSEAGYCFVAAAERNGKLLIAAVFGCKSYADCFEAASLLLDYGFSKK